jgi:hypothetical protein
MASLVHLGRDAVECLLHVRCLLLEHDEPLAGRTPALMSLSVPADLLGRTPAIVAMPTPDPAARSQCARQSSRAAAGRVSTAAPKRWSGRNFGSCANHI